VSSARDLERRYLTTVSGWLVSLPHDLKVLFEAKDEPNLDRGARELAAGAILYVLSPDISGVEQFVAFADDAIVLREALRGVAQRGGEGAAAFRDRFAEYYDSLDADLDLCRSVMGDSYAWLEQKMETLHKLLYKGKKVPQYIDDEEASESLYEDGLAFATDYPIDEEKLGMRLKKPETLLEPLRKKAAAERARRAG
jgi:hypothetical protein